jgi:hypothetical protein
MRESLHHERLILTSNLVEFYSSGPSRAQFSSDTTTRQLAAEAPPCLV